MGKKKQKELTVTDTFKYLDDRLKFASHGDAQLVQALREKIEEVILGCHGCALDSADDRTLVVDALLKDLFGVVANSGDLIRHLSPGDRVKSLLLLQSMKSKPVEAGSLGTVFERRAGASCAFVRWDTGAVSSVFDYDVEKLPEVE